jgi:hypothetical protein
MVEVQTLLEDPRHESALLTQLAPNSTKILNHPPKTPKSCNQDFTSAFVNRVNPILYSRRENGKSPQVVNPRV